MDVVFKQPTNIHMYQYKLVTQMFIERRIQCVSFFSTTAQDPQNFITDMYTSL